MTAAQNVADAIYSNGKIYTVDDDTSWAEAVAIKDGKFLAVGTAEEVAAFAGAGTETYDLEGRFVMPGLVDTHTHPFIDAIRQVDQLSIDGASDSAEDIRDQIAAYAAANPDKEWILGMGWPKGVFPEENPHRDLFDEAVADRPGCLMDQGGHSFWCNTLALEIAGVTADFEPPRGAIIETDADGTPSGTIRETALGYMKQFFVKPSDAVFLEAAEFFQGLARSNGITATRTATGSEDTHLTLARMAADDALTMRWAVGLDVNYFESAYPYEERLAQIERRGQYKSEFVGVDFVKIFVDGDINGFGIGMLKPFPNSGGNLGQTSLDQDELIELVKKYDSEGISIQFHAFGDRSIEYMTVALEEAAKANGGTLNTRHYPDHMVFANEDQIKRVVELNGLIGFAPYAGMTFPGVHGSYAQFLGEAILKHIQPAKNVIELGGIFGTGSDWNSIPLTPWPLLEGMIHRRNPWVGPDESQANNAAQAISRDEAIRVYTIWGAHALLMEDEIGSIEVGKAADFVVLDRDITTIPVDDISETQVLETVFAGRSVYKVEAD
ncbi:MAG: amidohydrolase [Ruegeria sp.]